MLRLLLLAMILNYGHISVRSPTMPKQTPRPQSIVHGTHVMKFWIFHELRPKEEKYILQKKCPSPSGPSQQRFISPPNTRGIKELQRTSMINKVVPRTPSSYTTHLNNCLSKHPPQRSETFGPPHYSNKAVQDGTNQESQNPIQTQSEQHSPRQDDALEATPFARVFDRLNYCEASGFDSHQRHDESKFVPL